jgi:hypothetical protein
MTTPDTLPIIHALADQVTLAGYIVMGLCALAFLATIVFAVGYWRRAQRFDAECRVRDRLDQEADPEAWAERLARLAHEAVLVDEELARMRRARWWLRWLRRRRTREEDAT